MKLIVGLGNPGVQYAYTRHNIGFLAIDRFAARVGVAFRRRRFEAECAETQWQRETLLLLKPQTFMNLSGRSVGQAVAFYKLSLDEVMVVHDELDLPPGSVRFKKGGGTAGHNGLNSIAEQIGPDFLRLRLGIGRPLVGDVKNYVLSPFPKEHLPALDLQLETAADALQLWLEVGLARAMQDIHSRTPQPWV